VGFDDGAGERAKAQVVSYGGGVDSFCMLLDALDRGEKPDALVFADVGDPQRLDPAEWPETYRHLRDVVVPFARKRGIPFYWLATAPGLKVPGATVLEYPIRPGSMETRSLAGYKRWGAKTGGVQIPTTESRSCTAAAKVERYQQFLADRFPDTDVTTWIGYDASEDHRIKRKLDKGEDPYGARVTKAMRASNVGHQARYPLMERQLDRAACKALIRARGLPVPRKSACVFCPFTKDDELLELLRRDPDTFAWIEAWERDKRATPTSFNVIMGMFGFKTFKLSAARQRVMLAVRDRRKLEQRDRKTLAWLIDRKWVSADGSRLTEHGRAILKAQGPDLIRKASTEPIRRAAGKKMQLGVHYESPAMREFLERKYPKEFACVLSDEETALQGELTGVLIHPSSLLRRVRGRRMR